MRGSVAAAEGFAARCSPFGSCTSIRQACSNVSLRESGHFPPATDFASSSRFCGLFRSLSTPRCRAAPTNASASSTPWFLARMSLMFRFDNGPRRTTVTVPFGETSRSPFLSFAASQSLHRHDSRNGGHLRPPSFFTIPSSGVRLSPGPARDSSRPSRNSVASRHSGLSSLRKLRTVGEPVRRAMAESW